MKPAKFKYIRPTSLEQVYGLLQQHEHGACILAGGQSLLAGLGMRLAAPEVMVDINGLSQLSGISLQGDEVVIGALTRHVEVLNSPIIATSLPLIAEAITHVAHMAIRNRGTFAGSLAYADPAAELPACAVAYGAKIVLGSSSGRREVPAEEFFLGMMDTARRPDELILEVRIPSQDKQLRHVFGEYSRRAGDFALAGLAGLVELEDHAVARARLVFFGCASYPRVAAATSALLAGARLPLTSLTELQDALRHDLDPGDSPGMREDTKFRLAEVLVRRRMNHLQEAGV